MWAKIVELKCSWGHNLDTHSLIYKQQNFWQSKIQKEDFSNWDKTLPSAASVILPELKSFWKGDPSADYVSMKTKHWDFSHSERFNLTGYSSMKNSEAKTLLCKLELPFFYQTDKKSKYFLTFVFNATREEKAGETEWQRPSLDSRCLCPLAGWAWDCRYSNPPPPPDQLRQN